MKLPLTPRQWTSPEIDISDTLSADGTLELEVTEDVNDRDRYAIVNLTRDEAQQLVDHIFRVFEFSANA
jgi:hypothetical protein